MCVADCFVHVLPKLWNIKYISVRLRLTVMCEVERRSLCLILLVDGSLGVFEAYVRVLLLE